MARRRIEINHLLVERLAAIGCTDEEIAAVCGVGEATIQRRARAALDRGRARLRRCLRRKQVQLALRGNVNLLIWLGKQYLGQGDRQDVVHTGEELRVVERIVGGDPIDQGPG